MLTCMNQGMKEKKEHVPPPSWHAAGERAAFFYVPYQGGVKRGCVNLSSCCVNLRFGWKGREEGEKEERMTKSIEEKTERGHRGMTTKRGSQRVSQKWEAGEEEQRFPFSFPFLFLSRHPDRAGNWTWTRLSLSDCLSVCLFSSCGSVPQQEPWGPEIADDKLALAFHCCSRLPHPSLTAEGWGTV